MAIQMVDPGFDSANVLSMVVELPEGDYPDDNSVRQFFNELTTTSAAIPDARGVALAGNRPGQGFEQRFEIEGRPVVDGRDHPRAARTIVSAGYLETMGIPLHRGRGFDSQDGEDSRGVAIISQAAAERYFSGQDPLGQRIRLGEAGGSWLEIVGVAGGTEYSYFGSSWEPLPQIYLPSRQNPTGTMVLLIRTRRDPTLAVSVARSAVRAVDPNQPVDDVRTLEQYRYDQGANDLALVTLFSTFACFALIMAAMGIYGVMSYLVSEQGTEISLRMALGAERGQVLRMILMRGVRLLAVGTALGMVGALLMSRLLGTLVVGVTERDPLTFLGVPLVLIAVALIANLIPALRATRMDPMQAMRTE
jgi:putative ABC transport system permease protein